MEKAHVRVSELGRHVRTRSHVSKSWRESLSDLEVTVRQGVGVVVMVCISVEEDAPGHLL